MSEIIKIEDFAKLDIRVGQILSVEKVPDTDKLLKLSVDLGLKEFSPEKLSPEHQIDPNVLREERDIRQIVSGIATYFPDIQTLVNTKCMFLANLEPRVIRGLESEGMILAVSTPDGKFSLLTPNNEIPVGTRAK